MDHADLDFLGGDHDAATLGHPSLRCDRPGGGGQAGAGAVGSTQPVPLAWRHRAGDGAQVSAVHPQGDVLPGQVVADADLGTGQANQPGGTSWGSSTAADGRVTTKADHNRMPSDQTAADSRRGIIPGQRPYTTTRTRLTSEGSVVRTRLRPPRSERCSRAAGSSRWLVIGCQSECPTVRFRRVCQGQEWFGDVLAAYYGSANGS